MCIESCHQLVPGTGDLDTFRGLTHIDVDGLEEDFRRPYFNLDGFGIPSANHGDPPQGIFEVELGQGEEGVGFLWDDAFMFGVLPFHEPAGEHGGSELESREVGGKANPDVGVVDIGEECFEHLPDFFRHQHGFGFVVFC